MLEIKLSWSELKALADSRRATVQYLNPSDKDYYRIFLYNDNILYFCHVDNSSSDATDFENNYKNKSDSAKAIPKTADGDWHVVHENFAHVSGNEGINWTLEKFIEVGEEYFEKLYIPAGRRATLNFLDGGSPDGSTMITLDWYEYCSETGDYIRKNPWIRPHEVRNLITTQDHSVGSTEINVSGGSSLLEDMDTGWYCFHTDNGNFAKKIYSIDVQNGVVSVSGGSSSGGIPSGITTGTFITLVDRPIGVIASQIGSQNIHWDSPPSNFMGDDLSYFKLTLKNEHPTDGCYVTACVNGWHTDAINGD